jgi:hypothetical protein
MTDNDFSRSRSTCLVRRNNSIHKKKKIINSIYTMKKYFSLFLLIVGSLLFGCTSVYAAAIQRTLHLPINCDKKCEDDALVLYRFKGMITETIHKNVDLVIEDDIMVDCSDVTLPINKTVQVRPYVTRGEWFVTGGSYDSPPSDGVLYELQNSASLVNNTTNRFYVGTSVPADANQVTVTSEDPTTVRCTADGCTALKAGTTNITLSFPTKNQVENLPVETRNSWGTFNSRGEHVLYELEGPAIGYGKILFMAELNNGSNPRRSNPIIMTYSLPAITCSVTVPPRPNINHAVSCGAIDTVSDDGAHINWVYTDSDDTQTNFQIQVATRSDFAATSLVKNMTAPANTDISALRNAIISDLAANTQYYVRIRAHNTVNSWSDYSSCVGGFKTRSE